MEHERAYFLASQVLDGSITAEDRAELQRWMDSDPSRATLIEDLKLLLGHVDAKVNAPKPDTDAAWASLFSEISEEPETPVLPLRQPKSGTGFLRYGVAAAIALLLMTAAFFIFRGNHPADAITFATGPKEHKVVELPDGSRVHLNAGSKLVAAAGFGDKDRKVTLEGEAYFDVASDPAKPFEVTVGTTTTTVLGTEFNLRSYRAQDAVRLSVVEGKVRFAEPGSGQEGIFLANESGTFNPSTRQIDKVQDAANETAAWREGVLSFNDEAMVDAVSRLNSFYDIEIRLGTGLENTRLTARFDSKDEAVMLDILATTFSAKVRREGKVAWLEK